MDQQDSNRYLQDYVQSLENLPSEIAYHWAEIQHRNEQIIEDRIDSQQRELTKIHNQWFLPDAPRDKLVKAEPTIVKKIDNDYKTLEGLADERVHLAEEALLLVDRHLSRLGHDLDQLDKQSEPSFSRQDLKKRKDPEEEEEDFIMAKRQRKRKKKEARDARDNQEPLYCSCRQVSFGEMVACDGQNCPYEWFHMECVGLTAPPKGAWYCNDCLEEMKKMKRKKDAMAT
ncbi:hypothetical protein F4703DRAFT_1931306 [Phycomyces blakesleeanus]